MHNPYAQNPPLPRWLMIAGSLAVCLHLLALGIHVLAAPSGPWSTPFGPSESIGPQFALSFDSVASPYYLQPLRMTHNYHYRTNRVEASGVFFEVRLKDTDGRVMQTLKFPDDKASFWVRHRQSLLADDLAEDVPVQARPGEAIPAPNQKVAGVTIWDFDTPDGKGRPGQEMLRLRQVQEHLIPRDRPVMRPSEWSLILAKSYARYLCRQHSAATAELIRHTREAIQPAVMFFPELPPNIFDELVCSFGEVRLEK